MARYKLVTFKLNVKQTQTPDMIEVKKT